MIWGIDGSAIGSGMQSGVYSYVLAVAVVAVLIRLAWIDIRTGLLPDKWTLPLLWAGLMANLNGHFSPLPEAVVGAAAGYVIPWSANTIHRIVAGYDGMGYGDFKLLAALGAWFGVTFVPWLLLGACVLSGGVWVVARAVGIQGQALPFGPALSTAGIAAFVVVFSG